MVVPSGVRNYGWLENTARSVPGADAHGPIASAVGLLVSHGGEVAVQHGVVGFEIAELFMRVS